MLNKIFKRRKKEQVLPPEPGNHVKNMFNTVSTLIEMIVSNTIGVHLLFHKDGVLFPLLHKNLAGEVDSTVRIYLSHGIFGFPILEQRPIIINNFYHDLKVIKYYKNPPEIGSISAIPLGEMGVLVVEKGKYSGFDENEIKFIKKLSEIMRNFLSISMEFEQREKEAEKFHLLYNLSTELISTVDRNTVIKRCLNALERIFAPDVAAFLGTKHNHPFSTDDSTENFHLKGSIIEWMFNHPGLTFKNDMENSGFFRHWENRETASLMGHSGKHGVLWIEWEHKKEIDEIEKDIFKFTYTLFSLSLNNIEYYEKIETLSVRDGLTGLYNHRMFHEYMDMEIQKGQSFGLLFIDIDHFKKINDTYGHPFGDKVIRGIAEILKDNGEKAFRYGGEEFALIVEGEKDKIIRVAEKLREDVEKKIFKKGNELINVTVSIGVSLYPEDGVTRDVLIKTADMALYSAKDKGRNRVVIYQEEV